MRKSIKDRKILKFILSSEDEKIKNEFQKFLIIVTVCCDIFNVFKKDIIKTEKIKKNTNETECTAFIFQYLKLYTCYRNIDIAFMLRTNSPKNLYKLKKTYCDNLDIRIPRHRDLLEKSKKCEGIIKEKISLL